MKIEIPGRWEGLSYDEAWAEVEQALDSLPMPWTYDTDTILDLAYEVIAEVGFVPKVTPAQFWSIVKSCRTEE